MGSDWSALLRPTPRRILDAMLTGARSLTEIAEATGLAKPSLVPHLKALAALGVVEGERIPTPTGSETRYRLRDSSLHLSIRASGPTAISWAGPGAWSSAYPLVSQVPQPEVRAEVAKFLAALRSELAQTADALVIILFGSGARGDATWKSDLDLLVLMEARDPALERQVAQAAFAAQMSTQHALSTTFLAREEWPGSRKRIVEEAKEEGIIVWAPRGEDAPWSTLKRYKAIRL